LGLRVFHCRLGSLFRCAQASQRRRRQVIKDTRTIRIHDFRQTREREVETTRQEPARKHPHPLKVSNSTCIQQHLTSRSFLLVQMEENLMRHRAILTGTFQRATYYNKPLSRMKVQPLHVSGMIQKRLRGRERRRAQHWTVMGLKTHMEEEARFERALERDAARFGQSFTSVFQHADWREYTPPSPWLTLRLN